MTPRDLGTTKAALGLRLGRALGPCSAFAVACAVCVGLLLWVAGTAQAQPCELFDECLTNGMCQPDGTCEGVPVEDGTPCGDPGDPCVINPSCQSGFCIGTPKPDNTPCDDGSNPCMTNLKCLGGMCIGTPKPNNTPCNFLPECYTGSTCQFGFCFPGTPKCADPQDPCLLSVCIPGAGTCQEFPKCSGFGDPCTDDTCNPSSGECTFAPANEGGTCDDFDECTTDDRCHDGDCAGVVGGGEAACVGDCNGDGTVLINEVVNSVNIFLENDEVSTCSNADQDGDGVVLINEVVGAVNSFLSSGPSECPKVDVFAFSAAGTR